MVWQFEFFDPRWEVAVMRRILVFTAVVALGVWAAPGRPGLAQGDKKPAAGGGDESFAMMASESDLAEINLGNLALNLAKDAHVKTFAKKMVEDHQKSTKQLITIADKKGLKLAMAMNAEHKALFDKLAKLPGEQFDHAYMQGQVKDHEKAVALFKHEAEGGKDADLKAFAAKTLPVIEHHLKMAREVAGKGKSAPEKTGTEKAKGG